MKKQYEVLSVSKDMTEDIFLWANLPAAVIENYPWDVNGYKPRAELRMYYTDTHFRLQFTAYEDEIKVVYKNMNEPVYKDSCVEFFFNPKPDTDKRYINIEMNAAGVPLIGIRKQRNDGQRINEPLELFNIYASVNNEGVERYRGPYWTVEYTIPFSFIEKYYGHVDFKPGCRMTGNFYKCGDETRFAHYGSWNPIINEKPDFHLPEFFGDIILR